MDNVNFDKEKELIFNEAICKNMKGHYTGALDKVKEELDKIPLANATAEVIDARGGKATLGEKVREISSDLDNKANFTDNNVNETFIAPFFRYNGDSSVDLYTSNDGFNFTRVSNQPLYTGRDSCPYYKNGYFYMLLTHDIETPSYEFKLLKSKNLRDWEVIKVNIGLLTPSLNKCWSGEFFEDTDGKLYITFSIKVGDDVINGVTYDNMRGYIIEVIDIEKLQFGMPRKLNVENINAIDHLVYKHNGVYYLYVKKEPSGKIQIWTSNDLTNWNKQLDTIPNLDFGMFEAMSIVKKDNTFIMYVDDCGYPSYSNGGNMQYCTSTDLLNWSSPTKILTDNRTRHGSIYKITDRNAKMILNDFISSNMTVNSKLINKNNSIRLANNISASGELWLDGRENVSYYTLGNENIVINSIANMNAQFFYVTIETIKSQPSTITIKNGDTILTPDNKDLVISSVNGDNEVSMMFRKEGSRYRLVGVPSLYKDTSNYIDLSTLASGGVISDLKINPNDFYYNSTATTITINNVSYANTSYQNIPMKIYFCINHTSINAKIVIKSSGMFKTKGNVDFSIDGTNNGDEIYCFGRLHAPSTMPLRKIV